MLKLAPAYWSVHTHSRYSAQDAIPTPAEIVSRAAELGYQGLALTDHGNMAGSIELYMACQKAGIKPFPGSEMYIVKDRANKKAKRYHIGLIAYTTQGYRNLIKISTDSHRNFFHRPLIDFADLARFHELGWSEGIAVTTGCFFGLVITTLINDGYDEARNVVAAYSSWFDTYVEIQAHNIVQEGKTEDEISTALVRMADELGLPIVISQDSHYVHPEEQEVHDTLKHLVSFGPDPDDALFPGDGFHLVDDDWMRRHHSADVFRRGCDGLESLLAKHDLRIAEADVYDYRVPSIADDPDGELRRRCSRGLAKAGLLTKPKYRDRLEEELAVIEASRMGNYMLLVALVCDYMRGRGIYFQTRGSAAGSLVCWMLGISNIDPLRWGARFDRFLSKDRTKPPDIDLDVENLRRREVMDWIAQRFAISQVCTWGVLGMNKDMSGKGSLQVKYFSKARKAAEKAGVPFRGGSWVHVPEGDKQQIWELAKREPFSGYGVHPCALVLVNSRSELDLMVPLQWVASSKTMVSQYDGTVIESIGLIKLDLLGSKTMSVLRIALENIGVPQSFLDQIPYTSAPVYKMLGAGDTDGLYQMEGFTTSKGCKELQPSKISEVIDAMALFRPGVMKSGATNAYLRRKFGEEEVPQRHEIISRGTGKTRGILLYQDQIIAILRDLGLSPDDLTRFLKAVKASNKKVAAARVEIDHYMPIIQRMCEQRGMSQSDWDWMDNAFTAFAEYSFNIAHATVYGITAYRCAYLAVHYGVEFHAALLAVATGTDKEKQYIKTTRRRKLKIKSPSINRSGVVYAMDPSRKYIRRGLQSIKGVGIAMARDLVAHQPYEDWADFQAKLTGTKVTGLKTFKPGKTYVDELVGTVKALHEAEAFAESIGPLPLAPPLHLRLLKESA